MYYEDIAKVIKESGEKSFTCEMINGSIRVFDLEVYDDGFQVTPIYPRNSGDDYVIPMPFYIARDIVKIVPTSKYKF